MNGIGTGYQAIQDKETTPLFRVLQGFHILSTLGTVGLTAKVEGGTEAAKEAVLSASLWGVPYLVSQGIRSRKTVTPATTEESDAPPASPVTPKTPLWAVSPKASASVSAGENKGAWGSGDNPPPTPKESEADKLIQRHVELLEELKKENLSGESKTYSRELQLKLARLDSDYLKFLHNSFLFNPSRKDQKVRGELIQRIFPSYEAVVVQYEKMGGDEKFPMMRTQAALYDIVNRINHLAQMSLKEQTTNMGMLDDLGGQYPARVEETQGIEGFDRTEFDAAGQTLAQLQAQYSRSLNWGSVDNPPPTPKESEADKLIQRNGELLEELKKENLSGESKTDSRELQLKLARLGSDCFKFFHYSSIKDEQVRNELNQRIDPSYDALWRQFQEMGGPEKFPMMWPQYHLYHIVNDINHFAQMSLEEQTANMGMLDNLGSQYPARVEATQGIEGLDRTEFDKAGQTLAQLQAQYPQSLN